MKKTILIILSVLALVSLACSISVPQPQTAVTGTTETFKVNEPLPDGKQPGSLSMRMGAGKLSLGGGAKSWIEGDIQYNVPDWKPILTRSDNSVTLRQEMNRITTTKDVVNTWNFKFGPRSMDLELEIGAAEAKLDLGGVPLTNLSISQGASNASLTFKEPNPEKMRRLVFRTGASKVDMTGLANANFQEMTLEGGAGSYDLDFSGKLQQAASARITCGVSDMTIRIPAGMAAQVTVSSGLGNITPSGTWTISGKTYEKGGEGPRLTITVDMGVGNLRLITEK